MKKYNTVIFDLDGTLADTSLGIYNCYKYSLTQMGFDEPTNEKLGNVIGAPLLQSFIDNFKLCPAQAKRAVEIYRKRYSETGIYEAHLYEGIEELLQVLKLNGYKLCVATLKNEKFAKIMLESFKVSKYFDIIHGIDQHDKLRKEDLIMLCIEESNVSKDESVLVGDSIYDANGAKACGIDFIGVSYGFGFKSKEEVYNSGAVKAVDDPQQLAEFLQKV